MRKNIGFLFSLLLGLMPVHASPQQQNIALLLHKEIAQFKKTERLDAISIAIFVDGKSYQYHEGVLADGTSPNNNSLYEIASITKTYTGLLLAQAVLDGKIQLDDPISRHLLNHGYSNLSKNGVPITFRHLATHTSGMPKDLAYTEDDRVNGRMIDRMRNYTKSHFMQDLAKTTLLSTPGEQYRYSNAGAILISYMLEDIYGTSYSTLLEQIVFAQSGEIDTKLRSTNSEAHSVVRGTDETGKLAPLLSIYSSAEGGLTTTSTSMINYLAFSLDDKNPLVRKSQEFLAGDMRTNGRSFFWNTFQYNGADKMLYHGGGSLGTSSWVSIYPNKKIGIFIVTNTTTGDTQRKLNEFSNRLYRLMQEKASQA